MIDAPTNKYICVWDVSSRGKKKKEKKKQQQQSWAPTMTNIYIFIYVRRIHTNFDVSIMDGREWNASPFRVYRLITNKMLQLRDARQHNTRYFPFLSLSLSPSSSSSSFCPGAKDFVGLEEVTKVEFLVMLLAETLGTFLLVLIGCASCITWTASNPPTVVHIAFTFGLAVASLAHVSHVFRSRFCSQESLPKRINHYHASKRNNCDSIISSKMKNYISKISIVCVIFYEKKKNWVFKIIGKISTGRYIISRD